MLQDAVVLTLKREMPRSGNNARHGLRGRSDPRKGLTAVESEERKSEAGEALGGQSVAAMNRCVIRERMGESCEPPPDRVSTHPLDDAGRKADRL